MNGVISDLKVRGGYGVTGNQEIGNYTFASLFDMRKYFIGGKVVDALTASSLYNPDIHWEAVHQTNIGIDLSMFDSRVNLSVDGYWKNTKDMLVKASIPITSGFDDTVTECYTNAGEVTNKGVEINLHTYNISTKDFTWETNINVTYNQNKIIDLNSDVPMMQNDLGNALGQVTRLANGYPINTFYGYVTDGIFQNWDEVNAHALSVSAI